MMIPVINKPRKDELFSSWITLTAEENGLSISTFAKAYLGAKNEKTMGITNNNANARFYSFVNNLFFEQQKKTSELYRKVTTFDFESMFMTTEEQARYVNDVFRKQDKLNPPVNTLIDETRICPDCYREDLRKYKQPYLHRIHQLSGVKVCCKHKKVLMKYYKKNHLEAKCLAADYTEITEGLRCQESMEAYADYAVRLFQSGIFTNIKLIKQIIRAKTMELGYSVKDKYKSMYWDIKNWKYSDLITYDIQYFMRVKLIAAEHMKPVEVVPVIMFLFPDADEFINNVGKTEQIIIDRTCPVCGRNYCTTKYAEKIGYRCPHCELKIPLQDRFRQYINNLDKEYIPQEDMTSMNKPVKMFHEKCGKIISIKPRAFLFEGVRCMCEHVLTEKEVIKKINSYDYFNFMSYDNDNDSVRIYCEVCHHFFTCNYHKFLKSPRCKVCNTRRMTAEIFEERVYNTVGDEYTIIKSFVDQKTKVVIRHELCGNIQEYKPSHFLDGQRCKYCGKETKRWEDSLKLLAEYKKETGNTNVPKRDEYKGESLGRWVQSQRTRFKDGKLTERQIQRLKDVGFEFDPLEAEWLRKYTLYEKYIKETGKTDISKRTDFNGEHLGVWINTQLKNYREGKLSDKRIELLKKTGLIK